MRQGDLDHLLLKLDAELCDDARYIDIRDQISDIIENEPTQGEWILVGERLPERYKEVIVTDIETKETYCSWYHGNGYWECDNGVLKNRIIAWQPLPEPYKEAVRNDE